MSKLTFEIQPMNLETAGSISSYIKRELIKNNVEKSIIRRVSIATYEAEINVVIHSYGGICEVDLTDDRLGIIFADRGPGIPDISLAMKEGYSTASLQARENGFGAGMGLPNIKNACDDFDITSSAKGTTLKLGFNI